ncbi:MAG: DNA polymerase III subunit alpha [Candidatus Aminicenantes bacterium]|nr:DNA polymerase III subunit alpha [Candidatus Aminicenantes bacterium]
MKSMESIGWCMISLQNLPGPLNGNRMKSQFIHLHNHTEFSILDGAVKIESLIQRAKEFNMDAVAITDHGNIFGAVSFFNSARKAGVKPILGCEMYVAPKGRKHKKPSPNVPNHHHLVLLVQNEIGYRNLCELITLSYLEGFYYRPRIDKDLLSKHKEGLIGLSACLKGEINEYLAQDLDHEAEQTAIEYRTIFGDGNFFLEIQDHGLGDQKKINPKLLQMSKKLNIPLVATNDVHYLEKKDAESHDVLLCIQTNKKVKDEDRIRFGSEDFYLKSAEEMSDMFHPVPEALENTQRIAARCEFGLDSKGYHLPHFKPAQGLSLDEYFERVVTEGFEKKMDSLYSSINKGDLPSREKYETRIKKEMKLVKEMGFEGYFLIVWDLIREAKSRNIPVGPGRGSAAGSLLAYSLGITALDPLEYDLLFERFLNPERISLPDIDIDFCGRRRDEVIAYIKNRYGEENVCQIITFGTMAARQAVRDAGRALDIPLSKVDKVAKLIPPIGDDASIEAASKKIPQLKKMKKEDPVVSELLSMAKNLEGQIRHPSTHAAGIVITPQPLVEFLPLYKSAKDEVTTQFPMQDIEALGLLKMDILGLRNLTVIQDTVDMVKAALGEDIDIEHLPLDDEKTFQLFQEGKTNGVFQFESSGMKDLLVRHKPDNFRDLIALNALHRPGPLQSGMTEDFIKNKNNPENIEYDIPELEPILKETKGLIVYQEQVMRIATDIAGFSMAEADLLRKAMGKKKASVMRDMKKRFMDGAQKKGVKKENAKKIFEKIKFFAGYGFNKSHSAAYAYLAYHTAYLKTHYPLYFMACLLTSEAERGDTPKVVKYINECREIGIRVLPPDINESDLIFSVQGNDIRFGLSAIKNVGDNPVKEIITARNKTGPFNSPYDICLNTSPKCFNKKVIESLIKSGAMDSFGMNRAQLYSLLESMIKYTHDMYDVKSSDQEMLFGTKQMKPPHIPSEVKRMPEWDEIELLAHEKSALGFYLTGHPLARYGNGIKSLVSHSISQLSQEKSATTEVKLAGIITSVKPLKTRREERMATFILEDMSGRCEVVAFPDSYQKYYHQIQEDSLVFVKAQCMGDNDNQRLILSSILLLSDAIENLAKLMVLRIHLPGLEESVIQELKGLLKSCAGDCPLMFELETRNSYKVVVKSVDIQGVTPKEELTTKLEALLGEDAVVIQY